MKETEMKALAEETPWEALDNMGVETAMVDGLLEVIEVAAEQEELVLGESIGQAIWVARMLLQRQRYRLHKHGLAILGKQ